LKLDDGVKKSRQTSAYRQIAVRRTNVSGETRSKVAEFVRLGGWKVGARAVGAGE